MNDENKDFFITNNEINISEEEIVLEPPTELFNEAKEIDENTKSDEKFKFNIKYDSNQKEFLLSMLKTAGINVENDDNESNVLSTVMNMTQLAFIKHLDCVEKVMTDEGINPFLSDEANNLPVTEEKVKNTADENVAQVMSLAKKDSIAPINATPVSAIESNGIAVSCAGDSSSSCYCPTNTSMESAATISDESSTNGYICCPGAEQWFKFTAKRTGQYTIFTTGSLDTIGTLYDFRDNHIVEVDDYAPCGKINFRIIINLTAGKTYYVKVGVCGNDTGNYTLRITEKVLANYVTINKNSITLKNGITYELPITPNYTYKGFNGAQRIPGLSVSIDPSNASEQKIWWWAPIGDVLKCSYGWDDDGDRYIHVTATGIGTAKLYAEDWNENGKRYECTTTVITSYEKCLQDLCGFSNEEIKIILKLYDKVNSVFASENSIQRAWKCARLLSEFSYDYIITFLDSPINIWNNVAGSVTDEETRKTYFVDTLGFTDSEYNILNSCLSRNHNDANSDNIFIDFTHMQYALAARLAYTLDKNKLISNLGAQIKTGNLGIIYSDEDISYLGGWLGDATLADLYGIGQNTLKNDDYMADLDAENIYRLILQGNDILTASNTYYHNMKYSNNRANIFLQHISFDIVKTKIFYELIDANLHKSLLAARAQANFVMTQYYSELIKNEQYHYDTIKTNNPDTYDFLMSLSANLMTLAHYE